MQMLSKLFKKKKKINQNVFKTLFNFMLSIQYVHILNAHMIISVSQFFEVSQMVNITIFNWIQGDEGNNYIKV